MLEQAGLVTTSRRGREKLHFLNPVPIRLVHDRWVSKYAEPWAATLSGLKTQLEEPIMNAGDGLNLQEGARRPWTAAAREKVFEIYIRTTPERLWEAITDAEMRRKYNFGLGVSSDWEQGSHYELSHPAAGPIAEGENLEVDPPRLPRPELHRAVERRGQSEGSSRVTWEIEPVGDSCRLTVTHDELREDAHSELYGGWPMILSGLKTLLETGGLLTTPGSLRYAEA